MRRTLRSTITWAMFAVASVGLCAAVVLIWVTTVLHTVSNELATAIESVRVTDDVEVQLLRHHQDAGPIAKGAADAALRRAGDEAALLVQGPRERQQVDRLRTAIDAYLAPAAGDLELARAMSAARQLSALNIDASRRVRERAAALDRISNIGGAVAAFVLLAGVTALLVWLTHGPFRHLAKISNAMERFAAGDLEARAPGGGEHELEVMAQTFNATADALVRARERQTKYVMTALHDLRTPLAAIQLAVGYFDPQRPLPPEARIRQLLELMGRQLVRLNALVGDVLNATWIEAGKLSLLRSSFDLRDLAASSVQQFRELAPQHVITLTVPEQELEIDADRARLTQVLNNLLSNAVKYSPAGSRVDVELARRADELVIDVSDEGPGISLEQQEQIFESFQRQSATHLEAPGTSLGLWVSQRVIAAHAGRLELDSHVGRGSRFRVVLPIRPADR